MAHRVCHRCESGVVAGTVQYDLGLSKTAVETASCRIGKRVRDPFVRGRYQQYVSRNRQEQLTGNVMVSRQ
jgi:hypothetical protein